MPQRATFKVPRLYKAAAKVTSVIKNENGNLDQLVEQYNKKTNAKALAALVSKTLKNEDLLDKIIENSKILVKEPKEDPWLFRILISELLLGKQRLPIGSKQIQTVLSYGPVLRTELLRAQGKHIGKQKKSKDAEEDSDQSSPETTKDIEESETPEECRKSQKRKKGYIHSSTEEDNLRQKSKKLKKSKKKKKYNQEMLLDASEDHIVNESIVGDEQLDKSVSGEEQNYNTLEDDNVGSTTELKRKKGKKNKKISKNSTHKNK